MNIFERFINRNVTCIGVPIEPRAHEEQMKDFISGIDVLAATAESKMLYPFANPATITVEPYNQRQKGSCGAHSATHAAMLSGRISENAPVVWYSWRTNQFPGMYLNEVLKLYAKALSFKYADYPDEVYDTEAKADALRGKIAKTLEDNGADYFAMVGSNSSDIYEIADLVNRQKIPVIVAFYSTVNEWGREYVTLRDKITLDKAPVRHYWAIVPEGCWKDKDGNNWFTVLESSPQGGYSVRHVAFDFLVERMYLKGYATMPTVKKSRANVVIPEAYVEYGQSNEQVKVLQRYLTVKGYLDAKYQTGTYYNITKRAVLKWQLDNLKMFQSRKVTETQLREYDGKYWGKVSILVAKALEK